MTVVTQESFSTSLEVPEDLRDYFSKSENYSELQQMIPDIQMNYDEKNGQLIVTSSSGRAIRKVEVLAETFFNNSRQKDFLIKRHSYIERQLSNVSCVVEEFMVGLDFMGLLIGTKGANISKARRIPGVVGIDIDEDHQSQNEFAIVKIFAKTAEAAESARALLEFTNQGVRINREDIGQVIGRNGKNIQEIVDKSGVLRVRVNSEENLEDKDFVELDFTGLKDAIDNAELLIKYQLQHVKDMNRLRGEVNEIGQKLSQVRSIPQSYYNRRLPLDLPYGRGKFSGADSRQPTRSRFPPPKHIQQQPQPLLKGVNASENVQNGVVETDEGHEGSNASSDELDTGKNRRRPAQIQQKPRYGSRGGGTGFRRTGGGNRAHGGPTYKNK